MSRSGPAPYLWMLASAFTLATMSALSKALAMGDADWRLLALARAGLMLVFAVPIALAMRAPVILRGSPVLWLRSVAGSLGMLCTFYSLAHLPISDAITLLNMYPIWVVVLSWAVLRDRPGARVWIAVAMSAVGVALIARPHFAETRFALFVGLSSSLCTAVAMLGLNRLGQLDARTVVVHFSIVATAVCGLVMVAARVEVPRKLVEGPGLAMLLGVGITGTLGQLFMTRAFALGEASKVSMIGLTQMIFAAAYDRLVWQRAFSAWTLVGMALVAAPAAWLLARSGGPPGSAAPPGAAAAAPAP